MKRLAGKEFARDADVKQGATSWIKKLNADFFYARTRS
jgi:hypothetical protein